MSKPRLSRRGIIKAAIQIADEKGLADVSLRGVAKYLGVHVTSLYNHVPNKDALLDEIINALVIEAKLPTGNIAWQDWVRQFASAMRELAHRHPGAFEALHHAPVQGEVAVESFEAAFAAFRSDGFDEVSTYGAVKATVIAVLGVVLDDMARIKSGSEERTDISSLSVKKYPHFYQISRIAEDADIVSYLLNALMAGLIANKTQ